MNELTAAEDIHNLPTGGVCILPAEWKWTQSRDDCHYYAVPVRDTVRQFDIPRERREQVGNMVYVGAVAQLFGIPLELLSEALLENFGGRERPAQMNYQIIEAAHDWAAANLEKRDPYRFAPDAQTDGTLLITGNEAAALGSIFGGVNLVSWYPITPSTSLVDSVLKHKSLRDDEDGKSTVAVVQGGRRNRGGRHGGRGGLGGRESNDFHERARHQPDERIRGPGPISLRSPSSSGISRVWGPAPVFPRAPARAI